MEAALLVTRLNGICQPNSRFVADDRGVQQVVRTAFIRLGCCQQRGKNRRAQVRHRDTVAVVQFQNMSAERVDHRRRADVGSY